MTDHKRELDAVYDERNRCVAAMTAMAQRLGWPAWLGHHEPANDPKWDAEWRNVVYIFVPTGQVSWHIHDRDLPLFAHLDRVPGVDGTWDGHTTEVKYKRLEQLTKGVRNCARCGGEVVPQRPFRANATDFLHLLCDPCAADAVVTLSPQETEELHRQERHPEWEYATTRGPRKGEATMTLPFGSPAGEGWEHNPKIWNGALYRSWDRDDVGDYSYWRRRKGKRCQHCGCLLTEGSTARDKDRYQRGVCGGCQ